MSKYESLLAKLRLHLQNISSEEKAIASRRYFPAGINCIGANAKDISTIIQQFHLENTSLSANQALDFVEFLLANTVYHEELMVAFGILAKYVKRHYDENLLSRFEYWLENYTNNWAQVDDLCMKTIYQFLIARPHLIEHTAHWSASKSPWCRRASNVVWVKFIHRKIGKAVYQLSPTLVFKQCSILLVDKDEFVQKSIGWLLKVTAVHYPNEVINYLNKNGHHMPRATIRYALEKLPVATRKQVLQGI